MAENRDIKPVFLIDNEQFNLSVSFLKNLFEGLSDRECESVFIVSPKSNTELVQADNQMIINYPFYPFPLFHAYNKKALCAQLASLKPTVLHCLSESKLKLTKYLAKRLNIPFVVSIQSHDKKRSLSAGLCKNSSAVITDSKKAYDLLISKYPKLKHRIHHINIGISTNDRIACFSPEGHTPGFVMVRELDAVYDLEPLMNAIRHLAIDGHAFIFAIIGKGPGERRLHKMIKFLGLSQNVTRVAEIHPIRSVLADSDIYIHTHSKKCSNMHLLEAMSVGLAVACSKNAANEMLVEDETAVYFDIEDELSIYSCLQALIEKKECAQKLAQEAQGYVRQHHTITQMVNELLEIYQTVQ